MMRRRLALSAIVCGALPAAQPPPAFLLSGDVVPRKHAIEITIDPSKDSFSGIARIEVEIRKPQAVVWLNGKDLAVDKASIRLGTRTLDAAARIEGGEFIGLDAGQPVGPGRASLEIRYTASLPEKANSGVFRKQVEGEWYAFTLFTPIDARRAFPCFDEPRFKTPWSMSIRVPRGHTALANAPQVSETPEAGGWKLVRFADTQLLPAEVAAFAAGPFDIWDAGRAGKKDTPVRVITPKGKAALGKEAGIATGQVLPRLEAYTGIPYPWDKLDHVALPEGAFGAVENPGLITYVSRGLLLAPGDDTEDRKRGLRGLQAHEIGHQWFGNLVTQADWRDVWLSEGFATWIAAKMLDQESPAPRKHVPSVAARERIMAADAGPRTRPVRLAMNSRDDTRNVYSQIVYQKGAAILLMLESWLGEDRVQKGVRDYLRARRFRNATTADFESFLRKAAGRDPSAVLQSFLDQTGIPEVSAAIECRPARRPRLVLTQGDPAREAKTTAPTRWAIPVCWRTSEGSSGCRLLGGFQAEVTLAKTASCPSWTYLNAGGTGYYRTRWTGAQLSGLASSIGSLTAAERLTLANDLKPLLDSQRVSKAAADTILNALLKDAEPEIVRAAKVALGLPVEPEPGRRRP